MCLSHFSRKRNISSPIHYITLQCWVEKRKIILFSKWRKKRKKMFSWNLTFEREKITRPSILRVTPQMSHKKRNYSVGWTVPLRWWIISGTWWYWVSIRRYWLVLGQYKLVLIGIRWYRVSEGLVCLYILEKVEIWSGVTDAWQTDRHQNIELLSLSPV